MDFFAWIMLQILLAMSCTYLIVITSRHGWSIVRVGTMIVCCSGYCFQYQLVFSCMEQRYFALKNNSPAEITCPSIYLFFVLVNTNGLYMIFQLRWLQHTFKHNTLLLKCVNWDNRINYLIRYPWFNTPGSLVSCTFLQKTHIFFTKRR